MQQAIEKIVRQEYEKIVIDEIIDIYNGKYKDYVEYRKAKGNYCDFLISPDTFYYLFEKSIYNTIKEKRDSAYDELQIPNKGWCAKLRLKGEIAAYNDVLSLMESKR